MALQSVHYDMFQHNNAIFREYIPSLKPFIAKLITVMNFITLVNFIANTSFQVNNICVFSNLLRTLCIRHIIIHLNIKYLKYTKYK